MDDNPADVRLLLEAFRELNADVSVRVAKGGAEALKTVYDAESQTFWQPDLISLDLNLPKLNGHEVLARLKNDPSKCQIPVIILSSSQADSEIGRAYDAHANAYVRKPTTLDGLLSAVRGLQAFWMETARLPRISKPVAQSKYN